MDFGTELSRYSRLSTLIRFCSCAPVLPCPFLGTLFCGRKVQTERKSCVSNLVDLLNGTTAYRNAERALTTASVVKAHDGLNSVSGHGEPNPALLEGARLRFIIWLAPRAGKMNQILRCDWLPERARWSHLARSGLPALSCKTNFPKSHIINPLLTKLVQSRWLDIGLVLFFACLWTSTRLGVLERTGDARRKF